MLTRGKRREAWLRGFIRGLRFALRNICDMGHHKCRLSDFCKAREKIEDTSSATRELRDTR